MAHTSVRATPAVCSEPQARPDAFRPQRMLLAPLSLTLYVLAWPENPAPAVVNATRPAPVKTSAMAGPTGNALHFIGGIAASFFLPLGYLGMSLLGSKQPAWQFAKSRLIGLQWASTRRGVISWSRVRCPSIPNLLSG